jgi:hypothetical protein
MPSAFEDFEIEQGRRIYLIPSAKSKEIVKKLQDLFNTNE